MPDFTRGPMTKRRRRNNDLERLTHVTVMPTEFSGLHTYMLHRINIKLSVRQVCTCTRAEQMLGYASSVFQSQESFDGGDGQGNGCEGESLRMQQVYNEE